MHTRTNNRLAVKKGDQITDPGDFSQFEDFWQGIWRICRYMHFLNLALYALFQFCNF